MKFGKLVLFSSILVVIMGGINFVQATPCDTYERDNGKTICISESTAVKLMDRGWELTKIVSESAVEKTIDTIIPNPTGYWVPIPEENREEFAKKFANAAGDSFIEKDDNGKYVTEKGRISMANYLVISQVEGSVNYNLTIPTDQISDKKKFIKNFMQVMGFEYDDDDVHVVDTDYRYITQIGHDYGYIKFNFRAYDEITRISIEFNGWTNNPELVPLEYPLSYDDAKLKLEAFAQENLMNYETTDDNCNFELGENPHKSGNEIRLKIISGVPYYQIYIGSCTAEWWDGHYHMPRLLIDANTGDDIILTYMGGLD